MSYIPESVRVELFTTVDGLPTWTNIGGDIVSPIKCNLGFSDSGPLARLSPGSDMRFDLNNISSTYDPSGTFYKGQKIRLRIKYGSLYKTKFFGYIDSIGLDVGTWGPRQAHVTVIDWLSLAAKTPIRALAGLTNTTIDLAVAALLTQMQMQPERTDFEVGNVVMPSVFDEITENSTVYSELQNLVMGEWGYIYMRDGGETLKVENAQSRVGIGADYKTTSYYLNDGVATDFLLEDGTNHLLEDNTNFLLEGEPTPKTFNSDLDEEYTDISINHGDNLVNKIAASAVPVVVGASVLTLYPMDIANGGTAILVPTNTASNPFILQGQYVDPTAGGAQVSGTSVVTPVLTTDYTFNSKADGTGSDLSANITITFTAGRSGFVALVVNTGVSGYFTKFNVRGKPVYRYAPVETVFKDQRSIWDYGDYTLQFTRDYGASSNDIQPYIFRMLLRDKTPRTIVSNPKFTAHDSLDHLAGFLCLDIGDQIRLASTKPGTDALYYIQGIRFTIMPGSERINFEYITAETLSWQLEGFTEIAVESTATLNSINFGYVPTIADLSVRAYAFRAKLPALSVGQNTYVFSLDAPGLGAVDYCAIQFTNVAGPQNKLVYSHYGADGTQGAWRYNVVQPDTTWRNYIIMFDQRSKNNLPIVYVDNVLTAYASATPWTTGAAGSEAGKAFIVSPGYLGTLQLENLAVYDRFLSTDEIATIHNGGVRLPFASYPADNLRFFFGALDDATYAARLNSALLPTDNVYDALNGFIGVPTGSPTLKAVG